MVLKNSGSLIAMMSSRRSDFTSPTLTSLHFYTYIPYYYKWIESVTGLELPKCTEPQEGDEQNDVKKKDEPMSVYEWLSLGIFNSDLGPSVQQ